MPVMCRVGREKVWELDFFSLLNFAAAAPAGKFFHNLTFESVECCLLLQLNYNICGQSFYTNSGLSQMTLMILMETMSDDGINIYDSNYLSYYAVDMNADQW